jgi:putative membrane protein
MPSKTGIFIRGLMMGAADIVPGVSGGTIALITGIYGRLLDSLRKFDLICLRLVFKADFKAAWGHVDGTFLLVLVSGIATSILTLARVFSWLLEYHPVPLWALFFGLILGSALLLLRQVQDWSLRRILSLSAGVAVAMAIGLSPATGLQVSFPVIFLSGFLAICAMILPGISGSFILVLLGMYGTVLAALKSFDLLFILVFAAGAAAGLLCFSRFLHWLLSRFHNGTMALLTGFLFGSLIVVWPWKHVLSWVEGSHGQLKPVQQVPVSPIEYMTVTGQDPQLVLCLLLMFAGLFSVWLLDSKWGGESLRE